MKIEPGTRVRVSSTASSLRGLTGVVVEEANFFSSGTLVLLDEDDESMFFSYRELVAVDSD